MSLQSYIQAAMGRAQYEVLEDDTYYGDIPDLLGVWGVGTTEEQCQEMLSDAVEGWIILGLKLKHTLPIIDGIDINYKGDDTLI